MEQERAHEAHGADASDEQRPGVPMEAEPTADEGAPPRGPAQQESDEPHFTRAGTDHLTPVYGTAQPPYGLCGQLRRLAYRIPEHRARHWALLMLADRLDVVEATLGGALGRTARRLGAGEGVARKLEHNALPVLLGAAAAGFLLTRGGGGNGRDDGDRIEL